jgi:peptidyl-tRNA hydrolase, PTH1 family
VGLGNPGPQYRRTRHNIGFRAVESLAQRHGESAWRSKFQGRFLDSHELGAAILLPQTFMNDSGESIALCASFYHLAPSDVLIVYDDINLPFGRLRFRPSGSDGGHNGVKSVIAALHSDEFPRLRIGIGRTGMDAIGHVLGTFTPQEEAALPGICDRAVAGIETFIRSGAAAAVALVNAYGGDEPPNEDDVSE